MPFETLNLREVIVFLVAAGVVVPLGHRLHISPVLGFLGVGLVIGPHGLGRFLDSAPWLHYIVIDDPEGVSALADLGVVFLLFMIGLELSLERLWAMRRNVFGLGAAQVVLTGIVIALIASAFDNPLPVALVVGAAFSLSSTAIVMQLLAESGRMGSTTGRTAFSILLFQDLAVLPILFLIGVLAREGDGPAGIAFAQAIGQAAVAVAAVLILGRLVLRPLFRLVGSAASREMFLAFVLLVIIGTALAMEQVGLSMALGAFLAGLLFAETEYRHEIAIDIQPFKGLLLGLFFISVGMAIDITQVAGRPLWFVASVFGLFLLKGPIIYVLARLFGESRSVSFEAALLLGQAGEFTLLIIGLGFTLGIIPASASQFFLIVTGFTMMVTPLVSHIARLIAHRIEEAESRRGQSEADMPPDIRGHVIIAGYGRVGQMLASLLDAQDVFHVGLDLDGRLVSRFRSLGTNIFYGDANRADLLAKLGAGRAAALVVTMDSPDAAEQVVVHARLLWPELAIFARARDVEHARRLVRHGASHVIPEISEASLQLGEMVLLSAGVPGEAARLTIEELREDERAAIDESRG